MNIANVNLKIGFNVCRVRAVGTVVRFDGQMNVHVSFEMPLPCEHSAAYRTRE